MLPRVGGGQRGKWVGALSCQAIAIPCVSKGTSYIGVSLSKQGWDTTQKWGFE